jgi:HK97 gp10 family phage protein
MANKEFFRIEGLKDLDDALAELPRATARNVLVRTLKDAGQPVADDAAARAPVLRGGLRESYTAGQKLSRRQKKMHRKESDVEVFIGPTAHPKSVQTEFGNRHQAPQPHLRPAWDSGVSGVLARVRDALALQIEKARARIARKAERAAAKLKQ